MGQYIPAIKFRESLLQMNDREFSKVKPKNDTLQKVYFEVKKVRAKIRATPEVPHGFRSLSTGGHTFLYRIGHTNIEIRLGKRKILVTHSAINGMTKEEWASRHPLPCVDCDSYDCSEAPRYLRYSVTPRKIKNYVHNNFHRFSSNT